MTITDENHASNIRLYRNKRGWLPFDDIVENITTALIDQRDGAADDVGLDLVAEAVRTALTTYPDLAWYLAKEYGSECEDALAHYAEPTLAADDDQSIEKAVYNYAYYGLLYHVECAIDEENDYDPKEIENA